MRSHQEQVITDVSTVVNVSTSVVEEEGRKLVLIDLDAPYLSHHEIAISMNEASCIRRHLNALYDDGLIVCTA